LAGARHRDVVQPTRGIGVAGGIALVPVAVEHDHMIELESFGAVRSEQQQSGLPTTRFAGPFGEPVEKVGEWRCAPAVSMSYSPTASDSNTHKGPLSCVRSQRRSTAVSASAPECWRAQRTKAWVSRSRQTGGNSSPAC